jgi:murein DD-endopeptidase MepM/ murein hydrolase activator NlpD
VTRHLSRATASLLAAATVGCGGGREIVRNPPDAPTRAEYERSLEEFGLTRAGLGRDWMAAADRALASPVATSLPFRETGYLAPDSPNAVAYRFDVRRGRKLVIEVTFEAIEPTQLFVDLFQLPAPGSDDPPELVAEADPGALRLEYDVRRDRAHVIRLQPELLRGGRYTIVHRSEASLSFPVPGLTLAAIRSVFGDPRDAGRRDHHGVDIFAPRGTPVVAAADGMVSTDTSERGGQVIWLRDRRVRRSLYYAHLNDWAVRDGTEVRAGDVIGFIGNTGNARTTPPHLHFGVYERGPADPYPFLQPADRPAAAVTAPVALIDGWGRTRRATPLRDSAVRSAATIRSLEAGLVFRVLGASSGFFRVELPDGAAGYVAGADATPAEKTPMARARVPPASDLLAGPSLEAPVIQTTGQVETADVFGRFGPFRLVRLNDTVGWLAAGPPASGPGPESR